MLFGLLNKIKKSAWFYPGFLLVLCLIVGLFNYTPNTFLTGWDTLHPEFDFKTNFQRLIFGVWRSDQGLGALAGHTHMADLPRLFFLWILHFVLPLNLLKYAYLLTCFILGPLGIFYLIFHLFSHSHYRRLIAFLTALLYIFNLSTLQQFYVPFEMFPTQWAFLPWIMLFAFRYLTYHRPRDLAYFSLFTLLAAPQAYAAHLWYPFFGVFLAYITLNSLFTRPQFKSGLILVAFTISVNSFWLFPNIYYALTSSSIPKTARVNRLASQEFLLRNRETGNINDAALIKGFYLNWNVHDFYKSTAAQLMPDWVNHLNFEDVELIGYLIFFFCLIGLFFAFFHKNPKLIPLSPFFIIPFILLANLTFPFNHLFDLLLRISILQEIFRFIFTKISVLMIFGFCIFYANFLDYLFSHIIHSFRYIKFTAILSFFALVIYCYPIFTGALLSPKVRVNIPDKYFKFWQFTQSLPQGRFLSLPIHTNSGWQYYSWQYQGSGFIWFGMPQSIFDRDSDRWQPSNERAYFDFFYSLYANNYSDFESNLNRYQVKYLLWDPSLISTSNKNQNQVTFKFEIEQLINKLTTEGKLKQIAAFDDLIVFETNTDTSLVNISTPVSKPLTVNDFYHDVLTSTNRIDTDKLPISCSSATCSIKVNNRLFESVFFGLDNIPRNFTTTRDTVGVTQNFDTLPHHIPYIVAVKSTYHSGIPGRLCVWNSYSNMCIFEDELSKHDGWDYFLIPPMDEFSGYEFKLNVLTYANQPSRTQVDQFLIIPLDYQFTEYANNLKFTPPTSTGVASRVFFPNNSLISIKLSQPVDANSQLVLRQAYHPGWTAFYLDGLKPIFLTHTTSDWANAWQLPTDIRDLTSEIYILFWPQLLEFIGFTLLIGSFSYVFWFTRRSRQA